jgi:hypothetical protein
MQGTLACQGRSGEEAEVFTLLMARPNGIKPTYIDIPEDLKREIKSQAPLRGTTSGDLGGIS